MHEDCIGAFLKCIHLNLCSEQRLHGNQARIHIDSPQENSCKKCFCVVRNVSIKIRTEVGEITPVKTLLFIINNSKCSLEVDFLPTTFYHALMKDCSFLKIFIGIWEQKQLRVRNTMCHCVHCPRWDYCREPVIWHNDNRQEKIQQKPTSKNLRLRTC